MLEMGIEIIGEKRGINMAEQKFSTVITSKRKLFNLNLK